MITKTHVKFQLNSNSSFQEKVEKTNRQIIIAYYNMNVLDGEVPKFKADFIATGKIIFS